MKRRQKVRCNSKVARALGSAGNHNICSSIGFVIQSDLRQFLLFSVEHFTSWSFLKVMKSGMQRELQSCDPTRTSV